LISHATSPPVTCATPLIAPIIDYDHTVGHAIIGGLFVTSPSYPAAIQGAYLIGDYPSQWIKYLVVDSNNQVTGGLQDLATGDGGAVSFRTGPDGLVYYAALDAGAIYRIDGATVPGAALRSLPPCRIVDTRGAAGATGGPALVANATRDFHLTGSCGVPTGAVALAVNVTVTQGGAPGDLRIFPAGTETPGTTVINFPAGQTRANNAVLTLNATGDVTVLLEAASSAHLILDVNGYFQ